MCLQGCRRDDGATKECMNDSILYADADGDGWGDSDDPELPCTQDAVQVGGDCDDANEAVHPDAEEVCGNGLDDNCDGSAEPCWHRGDVGVEEASLTILGHVAEGRIGLAPSLVVPASSGDRESVFLAIPGGDTAGASGAIAMLEGGRSGEQSTDTATSTILGPDPGGYLGYSLEWLPESDAFANGAVLATAPATWDPDYAKIGASFLIEGPFTGTVQLELSDCPFPPYQGGSLASVVKNPPPGGDLEAAFYGGEYIAVHDLKTLGATPYDKGRVVVDSYYAGTTLSAHSDLDGDGVSELLTSATRYLERGAVLAYDISVDGFYKDDDAMLAIVGPCVDDDFGNSVDASQDLDGDGLPELAVSRRGQGCLDPTDAYVFRGGLFGHLAPSDAVAIIDDDVFHYAGVGISLTDDVTGDGTSDLVLGTGPLGWNAGELETAVHLFSGPLEGSLTGQDAAATFITPMNANGISQPGTIPDRNGDGMPEIVVGSYDSDLNDPYAGAIFIFDSVTW